MNAPLLASAGIAAPPPQPGAPGPATLASARWPAGPGDTLAQLPGFVVSSFSPMAAQAAQRCLSDFFGPPPVPAVFAERTGVVLASVTGDIATAAAVAAAVDEGRRVPPLLFFQSNPNAVAGFLTARWGLAGPVVCTCPGGDALADARRSAALLITGGDAAAVLVIIVAQAAASGGRDHAEAELIGPPHWAAAVNRIEQGGRP
jgi:3-oxoacyl-(acyl-carrier-protein) synthase